MNYYTEKINSNLNWKLAGIYVDDGKSTTSTKNRINFQAMIDDCMAGKIDMIILNLSVDLLGIRWTRL